jgi:hypothetical protein
VQLPDPGEARPVIRFAVVVVGGPDILPIPGTVRERLVVILDVERHAEADLLHIRETGSLARLLAGLGEDRKEDRRENGNNGNNYKQLNEGESEPFAPHCWRLLSVFLDFAFRAVITLGSNRRISSLFGRVSSGRSSCSTLIRVTSRSHEHE